MSLICSGLSIAPSFVSGVGTKDHEDVLFKMRLEPEPPSTGIAESKAWKKPGCSLQDPAPADRPAIPRRLHVLDRQPGCSLQDGRLAASDRVGAAADDCERRPRDDFANKSSDNRDGIRATFGGYRGLPRRTRDRFGAYAAGIHCASAPGIPAGYRPSDRGGGRKDERLAGNTGSSGAGKLFPPRSVSVPTLRKSDVLTSCRVCYRVFTASPPLGCLACGANGSGQDRLKWRPFSPALTQCRRSTSAAVGCVKHHPAAGELCRPGRAETHP